MQLKVIYSGSIHLPFNNVVYCTIWNLPELLAMVCIIFPEKGLDMINNNATCNWFFRLSIVIMIFVNYKGGCYWFFRHSSWNGRKCSIECFWFWYEIDCSRLRGVDFVPCSLTFSCSRAWIGKVVHSFTSIVQKKLAIPQNAVSVGDDSCHTVVIAILFLQQLFIRFSQK